MIQSVTLQATGLASKWGFCDGDLLCDLLYELGIEEPGDDDEHHLNFEHEVLARLVEKHLLPVIETKLGHGLPVSRISTLHNPIRADGYDWFDTSQPDELQGIEVEVSRATVEAMARQVASERGAKRGVTPNGASDLSDSVGRHPKAE